MVKVLRFSSKKLNHTVLELLRRKAVFVCYQEHVSSICDLSCQILVQEHGKEAWDKERML